MTFVDLALKETYDSDEDDILNGFYIPVLSRTVRYDRLAGFFSSGALAAAARGMAKFIQNGGRMRLITSMQISAEDQDAIKKGLTNPDTVISSMMIKELDLADQIQRNHVAALAWMIAQGSLEIKIAIPLDTGVGFYTGSLGGNSLYHQKVGILYDVGGNIVSFSGSINETGRAWQGNIEEFKVFCSWLPGQDVYGANDAKKFEKFWYGNSDSTSVIDLPTAIRDHLLQIAPKTEFEAVDGLTGTGSSLPLRDYQNDAVNAWFASNMRGIFEMATGTGKTHAAISCIRRVLESSESKRNLVVVACPFIHLVTQWIGQLDKWGIHAKTAYGSSVSWQKDLNTRMIHLNDGVLDNLVIVTTHDTFASEKFTGMIKSCKVDSLIVADEVHKIGTERNSVGMLKTYDHRLGLSATPERYFDDEGTKNILDFFGGIVYKFDLDDAIRLGYLTHYSLFPHIVYMTNDEAYDYHKYSKQIAIEAAKKHPDQDQILRLSIKRSDIIKTAKNKIDEFKKILARENQLDHCLVYCSGEQRQDAASALHDMGIIYHQFTFREDDHERKKLLAEFDRGNKSVLLAIKCLDEGVDVPSTKTAIILASSRNPVEFIQRRGRILRPYNGKDHATIHDLIVLPYSLPSDEIYTESEKTIIRNELDRLEEFAKSSDNPQYSRELIQTFMSKYNL